MHGLVQHRHVARRTLVLNLALVSRVIDRLAPHGGLPGPGRAQELAIMDDRHVAPIETSSPRRRDQAVVTFDTASSVGEQRTALM